jgi:broad specificity phosphatase PhoE
MKIYFVRHGESVNNITGRYTGWMDVDLTEKGREDALGARELLRHLSFGKVYASDLKRARETAEIALPGIPYEVTPLIREIHIGDVQGVRFVDAPALFPAMKTHKAGEMDFAAVNGESYETFMERVRAFLDLAQSTGEERIAAFCHGGFVHGVLDAVLGAQHPTTLSEASNCAVTVVEWTGTRWKLITWNYTGKL